MSNILKKKKKHFFQKWIRYSKYKQLLSGNCEGTNKVPNAKKCIVLPSKLRPVKTLKKNSEFFQRNSKTMHHRKKSHEQKSLRITFYISVPNFRDLGPIIKFFLIDSVPLKVYIVKYLFITYFNRINYLNKY